MDCISDDFVKIMPAIPLILSIPDGSLIGLLIDLLLSPGFSHDLFSLAGPLTPACPRCPRVRAGLAARRR